MEKMKRVFLIFCVLMLSGCWWTTQNAHMPMGTSPLVTWGMGEAVSLSITGKMMEDHVASWVTGKECSVERFIKGEGKFCMTPAELARAERPDWKAEKVYCYKSIAAPTCYNQPSPYATDVLIGIYERPIFPLNDYD